MKKIDSFGMVFVTIYTVVCLLILLAPSTDSSMFVGNIGSAVLAFPWFIIVGLLIASFGVEPPMFPLLIVSYLLNIITLFFIIGRRKY